MTSYRLLDDAFSKEDINKAVKVLRSKQITMSKVTSDFERKFAKFVKTKYACMVNSGSSANLIAVFAAKNRKYPNKFKKGDQAIIPSLCWSTSLWPLVQAGLTPIFCDIDTKTLNIDLEKLKKKINKKTKVIMLVHVLGLSSKIDQIKKICKKKKIILIEDTCESLGTKYKNKFLGTYGDFGTYSFYYSHQITSGEGGMVVCNSKNDYNLIKSLRSHGWSRDIKEKNSKIKKYKNIDKRFMFINEGFNLRPTDVSAAIASNQLDRISKFIKIREFNRNKIINALHKSKKWDGQFEFITPPKNIRASWFGIPILVNKKFQKSKNQFLKYLEKNKVENRPIISGNFINQPCVDLHKIKCSKSDGLSAQEIEDRGFFIGLHTKKISAKQLNLLETKLLSIDKF